MQPQCENPTDFSRGSVKSLYIIAGIFVAVLLISNTVSSKIIQLGPFQFDGGTLLFPIAYIFGDILTEVYGFQLAKRVIWLGFGCLALMSATYITIGLLPSAPGWAAQDAYMQILGLVPRIAIASLIAYIAGSLSNSYIMHKMKAWTNGRMLWTRTIGSTIVGEGLDTGLFVLIAFYGVLPTSLLLAVLTSNYVFKVGVEVLMTPITYITIGWLKKKK
jgi:queuosine precursor transporter